MNTTDSLWAASLEWAAACAQVAGMTPQQLRDAGNVTSSLRFLYDNGLAAVLPAFDHAADLQVKQVRAPTCHAGSVPIA